MNFVCRTRFILMQIRQRSVRSTEPFSVARKATMHSFTYSISKLLGAIYAFGNVTILMKKIHFFTENNKIARRLETILCEAQWLVID